MLDVSHHGGSDGDRVVVGGWAGPDPWILHVGEQASRGMQAGGACEGSPGWVTKNVFPSSPRDSAVCLITSKFLSKLAGVILLSITEN